MRPLSKLVCAEEFVGDTSPRTAAYSNVLEEHSTGITHKLPTKASFERGLLKKHLYLSTLT
ncbi:MAG: palindromic element RPE1 domain-containing protein [Rickettsia endosymbiont of Gnoriste bilineata]|nr:palindromic element RPE1 domain-containing protein [Rickettsia endosymbiont of Gnoriste bilineata]